MESASMSFGNNVRYQAPRGAVWAAAAVGALMGLLHRLDQWLLAHRKDEPQTAEEVLVYAQRLEQSDPGFAADLRAAVMRSQSHADC